MSGIANEVELLLKEVTEIEAKNRTAPLKALYEEVAQTFGAEVKPDKIRIVTEHPGANGPIAVFKHPDTHKVMAAPIDPIVISFYEYLPTAEKEAARRAAHTGLREGVEMSGPLKLVDHVQDPTKEISHEQLVSLQNVMGNNSTWWPIKDYAPEEVKEVFSALELHMIRKDGIPVGIAHLDHSKLAEQGSSKIVFVALDPAMQRKGLGKEVLNEMMTRAIDQGAEKVTLDTVAHRDIRSLPGEAKPTLASAAKVYERAGFELKGGSLINPGDAQQLEREGLTINQLNGPLEYISDNHDKLRGEMLDAFGIDKDKALSKIHEWANEKAPAPPTVFTGKNAATLPETLGQNPETTVPKRGKS